MPLRALPVVLLLAAGCSSWDTGAPDTSGPERACLDTVTALAKAAERCGEELPRVYDQQLASIAGGDCKNVTSVRDEASLRAECIPSLTTSSCSNILAGNHDPSCAAQLVRKF